jgi:[ribosomal protein S5]-alanine N-acetyltransferase
MVSPFPVLFTERLCLRPMVETDLENLFLLRTDNRMPNYSNRETESSEDTLQIIRKGSELFQSGRGISWAITTRDSDDLIGVVGYWRMNPDNFSGEISYLIHPDYWRKGLTSEAVLEVLKYSFNELNLQQVDAFSHKLNDSSKGLLVKCGFEELGEMEDGYLGFKLEVKNFNAL